VHEVGVQSESREVVLVDLDGDSLQREKAVPSDSVDRLHRVDFPEHCSEELYDFFLRQLFQIVLDEFLSKLLLLIAHFGNISESSLPNQRVGLFLDKLEGNESDGEEVVLN
jgi:hypothetical protein